LPNPACGCRKPSTPRCGDNPGRRQFYAQFGLERAHQGWQLKDLAGILIESGVDVEHEDSSRVTAS
jgi:hypothetical protein